MILHYIYSAAKSGTISIFVGFINSNIIFMIRTDMKAALDM